MSQSSGDSRRKFLNFFLGGGVTAFVAGFGYPVLKYLVPPQIDQSTAHSVNAGKVEDFPSASRKIIKFGSQPARLIRDSQ